ncbi:hypothetical protein DESPIG_02213 [Desulfovibrio piger ATCC 29098]|uniref:Uncharacterized protein n=1 Tax=Desulfovibrio piger ATCC 29098 TaxID=411464 RepID=B6WVU5_9BACT|nr:hypothetical protein DESPIG_02213 [Desulfovibrio piger ATCC 29098]
MRAVFLKKSSGAHERHEPHPSGGDGFSYKAMLGPSVPERCARVGHMSAYPCFASMVKYSI